MVSVQGLFVSLLRDHGVVLDGKEDTFSVSIRVQGSRLYLWCAVGAVCHWVHCFLVQFCLIWVDHGWSTLLSPTDTHLIRFVPYTSSGSRCSRY